MSGRIFRGAAGIAAAWLLGVGTALAQAPVLASPNVSNTSAPFSVEFNWSATAGATGYRFDAGVAPGVYVYSQPLGLVTTLTLPSAVPAGTFYVRVVAQTPSGDVPSAEVAFSAPAPPAAPTGLSVARNGTGLVASWTPGAGGGVPSGFRLYVGTTPGGTLAVLPSNTTTWGIAGGVGPNTYYMRVSAFNAAGESAQSPEVTVIMPVGGACDAPPSPALTTSAWGPFLTASWTPVAGASSYLFSYNGGGASGQVPFGPGQTQFSVQGLSAGTWQFGVQAVFACGQAGALGPSTLVVDNSNLKMQPRAADPATGVPSYANSVVNEIAARYPGDLNRSCREHGGNNVWLFRLVEELRKRDKRWGLNWKRANVGDMSQDVITYNWGDEADEGTFKLRAWDVIGGHCGPRPSAQFSEITNPMPPNFSFNARWTLIPYIQAGFQP